MDVGFEFIISFFHALLHRSIAWHHSSRVFFFFFFLWILQNCVVLSLPGPRPLKSCDFGATFHLGGCKLEGRRAWCTMKSGFEKMVLQKNKKGRYEDEKRKKSTRFLVTINIMGSAGPIRFVVNEKEVVSEVIETALKSYAREGRLPVLGFDATNFFLYSANAGFDGNFDSFSSSLILFPVLAVVFSITFTSLVLDLLFSFCT